MEEFSDTRRLPVYLVLDTSGSMAGDPIEAVKEGLQTMFTELKGDPQTLEIGWLSIITFDDKAEVKLPFTWIGQAQTPQGIRAQGTTAMGSALELLTNCIDGEVRKHTKEQKGDWKPLVFLMTDGQPTDGNRWQSALKDLKKRVSVKIIACAAGGAADVNLLEQIAGPENVVRLRDASSQNIKKFIELVTASIKTSSDKIGQGQAAPDVIYIGDKDDEGYLRIP